MAVVKYSLKTDGEKYCSAHTKVKEMASKSGSKIYANTVLIDTVLMEMIEKLFDKLQCSKYIISSGYRTTAHDKAVGGNGVGQHTKGKAVDACFYDKNNQIISSKIVCCVAQDLGFNGIANISNKYKYVHLDMRSSGTYKGDEIKGNNTITKDFYDYFNISKSEVAKYTGEVIKPAKKSLDEIAKEVVDGKWGNGANRKKNLEKSGYNYSEIQTKVNAILSNKNKTEKPKTTVSKPIAPTSNYFPKYSGKSRAFVDALKEIGINSSLSYRGKIAKANGIIKNATLFVGLKSHNEKMFNLLKQGKLIKP